ncbi:MAG TPA: hypothetical protein PK466_11425 [Thermotogota bacterium]|nr:hypothetical protein [Thermotogota bacterium]HPJ89712.1 hypothetical protein [Thermotogota bacterium]HPR96935.1 hypothetical protein [Thermotogota bacterium]
MPENEKNTDQDQKKKPGGGNSGGRKPQSNNKPSRKPRNNKPRTDKPKNNNQKPVDSTGTEQQKNNTPKDRRQPENKSSNEKQSKENRENKNGNPKSRPRKHGPRKQSNKSREKKPNKKTEDNFALLSSPVEVETWTIDEIDRYITAVKGAFEKIPEREDHKIDLRDIWINSSLPADLILEIIRDHYEKIGIERGHLMLDDKKVFENIKAPEPVEQSENDENDLEDEGPLSENTLET